MTAVPLAGYLAILAGAMLLTLVLVPLALRLALRHDLLDRPGGGHKRHAAPVPHLGGAAVVLAFVVAVLVTALIVPLDGGLGELTVVLVLAAGISLVGLVDDLRGLGVGVRLGVVAGAAVVLVAAGVRVTLPGPVLLSVALTVLWVVGVTHAFNLLDNMDGLSAGVTAIGALTFALVAGLGGQFLVAALAVALAGCALSFLVHNRHPARIYLGDAGSLFLGFMLAVIGLLVTVPGDPLIASLVPVLALGMALLDTSLVTVDRLRRGRSPVRGGRDHVSHRLIGLGLSVPAAVGLIHLGAVGLGWLAVVMSRLDDLPTAYLLLGFVVALLAGLAALLLRVAPLDDVPVEEPGPGVDRGPRGDQPS